MNVGAAGVSGPDQVDRTAPTAPTASTAQTSAADKARKKKKASLSRGAQVAGKLADLSRTDPAKLKAVAKDVSQALRTEADKSQGQEKEALGKMADRFDKVAESGDVSALEPPRPPPAASGGRAAYARAAGPPPDDGAMDKALSVVESKVASA
jgi:hypothetical protein